MRPIQIHSLVNRRQRRQGKSVRGALHRAQRLGLGCLAMVLLVLAGGTLALSQWYASLTHDLPGLAQVSDLLNPKAGLFTQPTRLYDRTGQQVLLTLENPGIPRRYMKLDPAEQAHVSPELVRTTLALIDPTYWSNPGFDWRNLNDPNPRTIAERLALNLLLTQEPPGLRRALRMRLLAGQMVSQYGRVQVLEWYFNSTYYGHLSYGVESAARLYLDKSAAELTLAEAALLVPTADQPALNPLDAPAAAKEAQQQALKMLLERGALTQDEYLRASTDSLRLSRVLPQSTALVPAFSSLVLDQLSARLGRQRLERGGLKVITTLDYDLQLQLDCLTRTQLNRLEGRDGDVTLPDGSACQAARLLPTLPDGTSLPDDLMASGAMLDPKNGQVLALLGDTTRDGQSAFIPRHDPGSLLTPFAAVAEFARGYGPASLVWDIPSDGGPVPAGWKNPDGSSHGPLRLRMALANDYLTPLAQLLEQVGPANVWHLAANLGLNGLADERSSQILFSGGQISLTELANSYSVFANQGVLAGQRSVAGEPIQAAAVLYVQDASGRVLFDGSRADTQPVLSAPLAYLVHHVLADEGARWPTLGHPNSLEIGRPSAAKVGQARDGQETWAVGYTPQRLTIFWLGLPGSQRIGPQPVSGMWYAMMQYVSRELPVQDWQIPAGVSTVQVCDPSGQLPTPACPSLVNEVFLNGNEPVSADSLYRTFQVNRETGRLATVFTPSELVDERVYMVVPPEARAWAKLAGMELAPEVYDAIQPPAPLPDVELSAPTLFAYVHGTVTLRGSAGGAGFSLYRLQAGEGLNPQTWLQIGTDQQKPVKNDDLGTWDTQGLNGLYALRLTVVRQDQTVQNYTLQVTVDNTPPLARVLYPLPEQAFAGVVDRQITFQAEALDAVGVAKVEWLLDGKLVGQNLAAPYGLGWQAKTGEHTLVVRATDLAGNVSDSAPVKFNVSK